jgi:TPP-dependent pyruvate/acetoin dehydrogenase alpha subunit
MNDDSYLGLMLLVRRTEEKLLEIFAQGKLSGTTHTSIGQESCSVGVVSALDREKDIIFSNHRCHGHFIVYSRTPDPLVAEVMGKCTGVCCGIGGSQHVHYRNFYSNGIQGGIVPPATGMALAEKLKGSGAITTVFIGDGTLGQGVVYESFNIASLWSLPILFVIEANCYAQSTPTCVGHAGDVAAKPRAFGIETVDIEVEGPAQVFEAASELIGKVRSELRPACLVLHTYRLGPHSKGDDVRADEEIAEAARKDPLNRMLARMPKSIVSEAESKVAKLIEQCLDKATAADGLCTDEFCGKAGLLT